MPTEALIREVERFLYWEARLLDERRFHEWLELLTDDVHYAMSSRPNRYPTSSRAIAPLDRSRRTDDESATEDQLALFDETKQTLTARVARLDTGMAWAEDPPSRTRHFIANVDVEPSDVDGEVKVRCNYIVYRSRGETEQDFYVGTREDLLRWVEGGWKIARRRLILDQNVLTAKNLSILF